MVCRTMKPNELMQAVGSLIEEISSPYERNTGEQAKLTREQWALFVERIEIMRVLNMPRLGESDGQ